MGMSEPLPLVYLDTNFFVRALESSGSEADAAASLLCEFRNHPGSATTSELTLAELTAPIDRPNALPLAKRRRMYLGLLIWNKFIELAPVSREILLDTADFRAAARQQGMKIKLPDAIHMVTAIKARCTYVLTSDQGFHFPEGITALKPDIAGLGTLTRALHV
jgi:predicted nucleic acid-binding protein